MRSWSPVGTHGGKDHAKPDGRTRRLRLAVLWLTLATCAFAQGALAPAASADVPAGFQDSVVLSGLTNPTALRFASDGRVFVAEKSGRIWVFDSLTDTTPTLFADLSTNVYNYWDRGLLGLALHPNFPLSPYVYVLYTYDAVIGGTAPRWGTPGVLSDPCPSPPGPNADGCVAAGRLSRLTANGNTMTGSEQVFIEDYCQQYPSLSVGSLVFGSDGALYASGGTASSFTFNDWGQDGSPLNPCGDPPGGVGATLTPPTAEGGSLRAQDIRTTGDPVGLDGTVIRIDPAHRCRSFRQPARRQRRPQCAPNHRLRPSQPVPLHDPPGHERGLDRRRGKRQLRGDQPHHESDGRGRRELRLALLRGAEPATRIRSGQLEPL